MAKICTYQSPPITPEFADYLIQRIKKKSRPLYHIIRMNSNLRRGDTSGDPNILLHAAAKERDEDIIILCNPESLPNMDDQPVKDTIIILIKNRVSDILPTLIPIENLGVVVDRFMYNSKLDETIVKRLEQCGTNCDLEVYTNMSAMMRNTRMDKSKQDDKTKKIPNDVERPECIYKAYSKNNTIICELINMFRDRDFEPILVSEIKSNIPSFKVSNYDRWDKAHSKYKLGEHHGKYFVMNRPCHRTPLGVLMAKMH